MKTLRYGLIGCGMMGQEHIRNVALLADADVVALYDPDPGMIEKAGALVPEADVAPDLDSLLSRQDLDALIVASPNDCHADHLRQIAAYPHRPVLMEKPLFTNPADRDRLIALADQYRAPIWVAMEYRYMPPIAAFLEQVEAATGGIKMLTIREHRFPFLHKVDDWNRFNVRSGGTLVEKCCHFFDLMRLILGSEPVSVMASGGQSVNHLDEVVNGAVPDIWDNAFVIVDFENGARAMLELCMFAEGSEFQEEISALGPKGKIEAKVPGPSRFWSSDLGPEPIPQVVTSPRDPKGPVVEEFPIDLTLKQAGDHHGSTYFQHLNFRNVARGLALPDVSFDDGLRAVEMGMAAQESARLGEAVAVAVMGLHAASKPVSVIKG